MIDLWLPIDPILFSCLAALLLGGGCALACLRPGLVTSRPRSILLVLALLSVAALVVLVRTDPPGLRLEIDPSTEPLLPSGDPARALYLDAVRNFGDDEIYVIAMEADDVFRKGPLEALRRVNDGIARLPGVRKIQSLVDVISFDYVPEEDWLEVRQFIDEIPSDPVGLKALRKRALANPLFRRTLVSEDGRTAAVNVTFREMSDREFIASGLDERITELVRQEITPEFRFYVAGRPHVKAHVYHQMVRDLRVLIPMALLVISVILYAALGTRRGVVFPLATVLVANLWTFAAMALLDRPLSILTTLLGPLLIAIGSVYGVHVVARYDEHAPGASHPREAAQNCLVQMRLPVLIAGVSTMIGFAALLVSDVPAVFELGSFAVFGVGATTLLTLAGLPATLALLPLPAARTRRPSRLAGALSLRLDRVLAALGAAVARRASLILVVWGLLTGIAVALIPRIVIDTDYLSFFDESSPVRRDFEAVNQLLSGAIPLYVSLEGDEPGTFREPAPLRVMEQLQLGIDALPDVGRTLSMADTVRVMNRALSRDDPKEERIPDSRGGVAELVFLTPKGHLDRYTNVNHARANVLIRTGAVGTAAVRTLTSRIEELLREHSFPDGIQAGVTGNALLLARSADGIARGQPLTVGLAVGAIFVLVTVGLRSFPIGLLAMVPNVVPVLIFFGLLGLGVAPLSLPTSLIGSVALGIAIDDTVHYLVRYRRERRGGLLPGEAVQEATRRVGRPIVITSVMLFLGFLVVALSEFSTLREFGFLSAATMVICLATDLVLLPALLVRARA